MRRNGILIGALAVALAVAFTAWPAVGSLTSNTFSDTGTIINERRVVLTNAQITCTQGQLVQVRATISQGDAFAQDGVGAECTGAAQTLPLRLRAETNRFEDGPATICGLALNRVRQGDRAPLVDTRQWCREVTLAIA